jgi:Family of unknown function (DUF6893)
MDTVGWVATGIVGVLVVGSLYIGVRSIPDMRRYLRIRNM